MKIAVRSFLYVTVCIRHPRRVAAAYTARVNCIFFISVEGLPEPANKMSKDKSLRFFCAYAASFCLYLGYLYRFLALIGKQSNYKYRYENKNFI